MAVILDSRTLRVDPGSEVSCDVRLRNTGTVVDRISLEVLGNGSRWTSVDPPSINLYPGAEATIRVRFAPPRTPESTPGPVPFTLRALSGENASTLTEVNGTLEIGIFRDLRMDLLPHTSSGWFSAEHQLILQNHGNAPARVSVNAATPDETLSFKIGPQTVTVPPGQADVSIRIRPRRWLWLGTPRVHPFQVTATPDEGEPISAGAHMNQRALLPRWVPRVAMAAILVAGLLFTYLHLWGVVPEVSRLTGAVAGTRVQRAGFSAKQIAEASDSIPAGMVIRTIPDANARVRKGSSVKLYYSAGANPISVPNVIGLDGQVAVSQLQAASFIADQVAQDNQTVSTGRVISSEPPANALAPRGAKVTVFVSKGPPGLAGSSPPPQGGTGGPSSPPPAAGRPAAPPGLVPLPVGPAAPPGSVLAHGPAGTSSPAPSAGPTTASGDRPSQSASLVANSGCAFDTAGIAAPTPAQPIPGLAVTINNGTRSRNAYVQVSANAGIDADAEIRLAYSIDGGPVQENVYGPANLANHQQYWEARSASAVIPLGAGTHTITPFWRVSGASGKSATINQRCMTVVSVANP